MVRCIFISSIVAVIGAGHQHIQRKVVGIRATWISGRDSDV